MQILNVKKGEVIAAKNDKVEEWYFIQKGSVCQHFEITDILLETNSVIGLLENGWFICDYVAAEDSVIAVLPCKDARDLSALLQTNENFRTLFLRSALLQRHKAFGVYSSLSTRCFQLHSYAESFYADYSSIAEEFMIEERSFPRIENFEPIHMTHLASEWEIHSSNSLIGTYFSEYMHLMMQDDSLCIGAIMECGAQMRRVTQGIEEMVNYLLFNKDLLLAESEDDLFHMLYFLAVRIYSEGKDVTRVQETLGRIIELMKKLGIYSQAQIDECIRLNSDYGEDTEPKKEYLDIRNMDCVAHIMRYAGYTPDEAAAMKADLDAFAEVPDKSSLDADAFQIRKRITKTFYEVYEKAFLKSMEDPEEMDTVMAMFFYFGFMDCHFLGEEHVGALVGMVERIGFFQSFRVFTAYDWLTCIYNEVEEPSRSELDMDFNQFLADEKKNGRITADEMNQMKNDPVEKVRFEIQNLFTTGHRITYGRVTSFCPVLSGEEIGNSLEKMSVTSEKVEKAINELRRLDYSVFFREDMFSDPEHGIPNEKIMREILPNVILMPTIGSRGMMWQETAGVKSNTPARFLLPIFTGMDLDDTMIEIAGRYRWEFTKHVMGVRWNDIREKSLTAEYTDYLQFYKKNHEISQETKEKIKSQLSRAKNSYREVFVRDYINWLKYESKGGFRLNKVARTILVTYCPFSADIRNTLNLNPMYENAFRKRNADNLKAEQRLNALYDKYEKAGGFITTELRENLKYYRL